MRKVACGLFAILLAAPSVMPAAENNVAPLIGEVEKAHTLADANRAAVGVAFDEISPRGPRLFVLDRTGKVFVYALEAGGGPGADELRLTGEIDIPPLEDGRRPKGPRRLAYAIENDRDVLYFLNWEDHLTPDRNTADVTSELWRFNPDDSTAACVQLSFVPYRIGDRELLGLAYNNGKIFVSFDGSGYNNDSLRVHRGIIQLEWDQTRDGQLDFVKHMPDSGEQPSQALAFMVFEGARYLWGTVGAQYIYSAEGYTGRGLFHFDSPVSADEDGHLRGLAFGAGSLWAPEPADGPDRICRINVTRNLDAAKAGPRQMRHLTLGIVTLPEKEGVPEPGEVYHNYSRPFPNDQMPNQGTWPETESLKDRSGVPNAKAGIIHFDPAGDRGYRQYMGRVVYGSAPAREYESEYRIDLWTNFWRKYVYPHRADRDETALADTDYREDDPVLFNLWDKDVYEAFFERVRKHIRAKYGAPVDMENPYWAARNCLEYIQDSYYYPSRPHRIPASVDYERNHYDANPGNLKIDLSRGEYNKDEIIACSGTSVMLAGAMRYLGFPARWLGTGNERPPADCDGNGNGLLDEGESARVTSGHRYTQVWLGSRYGWVCFDATPTRPDNRDFDPPPPIRPQWRFMNRAARGHLKEKRIVFNVGSRLNKYLYRDFEYDEKLAINNDCGGDQRYNSQGRFEKPELWKLSRHRLSVTNMCFVTDVKVTGEGDTRRVTWGLKGEWKKDPEARLEISLQRQTDGGGFEDVARPAEGLLPSAGAADIELGGIETGRFRVIIRKQGDSETGGVSEPFDLN